MVIPDWGWGMFFLAQINLMHIIPFLPGGLDPVNMRILHNFEKSITFQPNTEVLAIC